MQPPIENRDFEDFLLEIKEAEISIQGVGSVPIMWPKDDLLAITNAFRRAASSPADPPQAGASADADAGTQSSPRREVAVPHREAATPFSADEAGRRLFDLLFSTAQIPPRAGVSPGTVREVLFAKRLQRPQRLRLDVRTPLLRRVPWELLFDGGGAHPIGAVRTSLLVRNANPPQDRQPAAPAAMTRLSVLAIGSNPARLRPLDLVAERRNLEKALGIDGQDSTMAIASGRVGDLRWVEPCDASSLQLLLEGNEGRYHVLHFAGHAGLKGNDTILYLTGANGEVDTMKGSQLGHILRAHPTIRLVVLNACEGAAVPAGENGQPPESQDNQAASIADQLAGQGVPAVIAMQAAIQDPTAGKFAKELYLRLARGEPIDVAMSLARLALRHPNAASGEWAIPVLTLSVKDAGLFERPKMPAPVLAPLPVVLPPAVTSPVTQTVISPVTKTETPPAKKRWKALAVAAATVAAVGLAVTAILCRPPAPPPPSLLLTVDPEYRGDVDSSDYHIRGTITLAGAADDIDARCKRVYYCAVLEGIGFVPVPMNGVWIGPRGAVPPADAPGKEAPAVLVAPGPLPAVCPSGLPSLREQYGGTRFRVAETFKFKPGGVNEKGQVLCEVTLR